MRIKLLCDGGYVGLGSVKFPVEVDATLHDGYAIVGGAEFGRLTGEYIRPYDYLFNTHDFEIAPFDITKHDWSDDNVHRALSSRSGVILDLCDSAVSAEFSKSDIVAMAKYLGVKAEDLA